MTKRRIATYVFVLAAFLIVLAVLQTAGVKYFKISPQFTLAAVCAIGFIFGEKAGAISGVFAGIVIDCLGFSGLSYSAPLYLFCGYMCGKLVGWFLSYNLPSYIVYISLSGIVSSFFTFAYYLMFYDNYFSIVKSILIPNYISLLICAVPIYYAVKWIYRKCRKL